MSEGHFRAFLLLFLAVCCLGESTNGPLTSRHCHVKEKVACQLSGLCANNNTFCGKQGQFCYTMWTNVSGNVSVSAKGCWQQNDNCLTQTCTSSTRHFKGKDYYFCCCNTDFCNEPFGLEHVPMHPNATSNVSSSEATKVSVTLTTSPPPPGTKDKTIQTLLYLLPVLALVGVLVVGFFIYRRHKTTFPSRIFEEEPLNSIPPPSPDLGARPIQLREVISQGQFGRVWKADYLQDTVAVKVFSSFHKAAWACEKEFYSSCNMKHENILNYIAAEKHSDGQFVEYWLITEYHESGSLADYLKGHVISWAELCSMAGSMASGLAYLHSEIPGAFFKPCIAHRDFKSKNVLVKKDLTCCLSDFGLAIKFEMGEDPGETHGQVGTRRYMAPEVLEGAINFTREAFLHIDVYALALVLWELASRCTAVDGPVGDYRMPFEEEVGSHLSLEDMQQAVVHKKIRPKFRADWFHHNGMASFLQTIEECWDQDAEARLSAPCVAERVSQFQTMTTSGLEHPPAVTTVVNDTNDVSVKISSKESII